MDELLMDLLYNAVIFCLPIALYIFFLRRNHNTDRIYGIYSIPGWNFLLKKWWAYLVLKKLWWQKKRLPVDDLNHILPNQRDEELEKAKRLYHEESMDSILIFGADSKGNHLYLKITRMRHRKAEIWLQLKLADGSVYQLPNNPHTTVYNNLSKSWRMAGLDIQVNEPLRRYRIVFDGLLRQGNQKEWNPHLTQDLIKHVKFNFLWMACSGPVDYQNDWNINLLCEAVAREPWRDGKWLRMAKELGHGYDQWGTLHGIYSISNDAENVIYLRGLKQRHWGLNHDTWKHRSINLTGVASDGTMFALAATASLQGISQAIFGHVQESNGNQATIDWCDLSLPYLGEYPECIPRYFVVRFSAGGKEYIACMDMRPSGRAISYGGHPWTSETHLQFSQCSSINMNQALAVSEFWYRYNADCPVPLPEYTHHLLEPEVLAGPLVVSFSDIACHNSSLVGWKAASLALIDSLCDPKVTKYLPKLRVPPGFCLTTTALEHQLAQTPQLQEAVNILEKIFLGHTEGELKGQCDRTVSLFEEIPLNDLLKSEIRKALQMFDPSTPHVVRSSVNGEDSKYPSVAGQNVTILQVIGESTIFQAIQKCWGSLYTYQSVEYRRQKGQKIQCFMGVVIQTMIPAEASGVLYTRHPVTGCPSQMLITASYGRGKSVTPDQIEADTIIFDRNWQDRLTVQQTICGSKSNKTEMEAGEGGTEKKAMEPNGINHLCISTHHQLELGQIGIELENKFGAPCEVEWAIVKEHIYLLQVQLITSFDLWSDFELLHELDSPIITENELLTTANIGEVFSGAISPLTQSFLIPILDASWGLSTQHNRKLYYMRHLNCSHHHIFLNMLNTIISSLGKNGNILPKAVEIGIFGHSIITPELCNVAIKRNGVQKLKWSIQNVLKMIPDILLNNYSVRQTKNICKNIKLNACQFTTSKILYKAVTLNLKNLMIVSNYHCLTTRVNILSQVIALSVLSGGKNDITEDNINDIVALLYSCTNDTSPNLPTDLKALADSILETNRCDEFCALPPDLAIEWLELNSMTAAQLYKQFLIRYGHHCIRESDIMNDPWCIIPEEIIKALQTMVNPSSKASHLKKAFTATGRVVTHLKSMNQNVARSISKILLPWCKQTIANQKASKTCLTSIIHEFRVAYCRLGRLLQREGRLPDPELIFFMTHYEVGRLIQERDAKVLLKASRRRRLWTKWDKFSFPEITKGVPTPIDVQLNGQLQNSCVKTRLQGTPASPGAVLGRACVIFHEQDVAQLQNGDILITQCSDIGWSLYFPLLGGLVTELGGVISHGAAIAREYGLPCIVGAHTATTLFKTGDTVLLIGDTGILEKIDDAPMDK